MVKNMKEKFRVKQISDGYFIFEILYQETKANDSIVQLIGKFINKPYAGLRRKHIPDLRKIRKRNILLVLYPSYEKISDAFCPAFYDKPKLPRPYILIGVHLKPTEDAPMVDFSILSYSIPHEILHELYDDEKTVNQKLTEFHKHCDEQMKKDFQ